MAVLRSRTSGEGVLRVPVNAVFLSLLPMPWYQRVEPGILAYQILDYPQTALWLTVVAAIALEWRRVWSLRLLRPVLFTGIGVFFAATVSAILQPHYAQIALPCFLLAAAGTSRRSWCEAILLASLVIISVHVVLLLRG